MRERKRTSQTASVTQRQAGRRRAIVATKAWPIWLGEARKTPAGKAGRAQGVRVSETPGGG